MNFKNNRTNIPLHNSSVSKKKEKEKEFVPEARRTTIATMETFLDDMNKPRVPKEQRPAEVARMLDLFTMIENRDYYIIGYGSLMNTRSREKTYKSKADFPAIVHGWQRVFNIGSQVRKATVLNVFEVEDAEMPVVITKVSHHAIFNMLMREWQYDVVEIDPDEITTLDGRALPLESKPLMVVGRPERAVSTEQPMQNYVQTCVNGCASYSREMAEMFMDSTYLADKTTTLRTWMQNIMDVWCDQDSSY